MFRFDDPMQFIKLKCEERKGVKKKSRGIKQRNSMGGSGDAAGRKC